MQEVSILHEGVEEIMIEQQKYFLQLRLKLSKNCKLEQ
jgi:hypothetical protein